VVEYHIQLLIHIDQESLAKVRRFTTALDQPAELLSASLRLNTAASHRIMEGQHVELVTE
jgi:hypothetical protein